MGRPDCVCFLFCETKRSFFSNMDKMYQWSNSFLCFSFSVYFQIWAGFVTPTFSHRCSSGHVISMCGRTVFIQLACYGRDKRTWAVDVIQKKKKNEIRETALNQICTWLDWLLFPCLLSSPLRSLFFLGCIGVGRFCLLNDLILVWQIICVSNKSKKIWLMFVLLQWVNAFFL